MVISNGSFGTVVGFLTAEEYLSGPVATGRYITEREEYHGRFLPLSRAPKRADLSWIGVPIPDLAPHTSPTHSLYTLDTQWPLVRLDNPRQFASTSALFFLAHPRALNVEVPAVAEESADANDAVWRVAVSECRSWRYRKVQC